IRLPKTGHYRMTGRLVAIAPHPEPKSGLKSDHAVMAHEFRPFQQGQIEILSGLPVIVGIAQLDRSAAEIVLARYRVEFPAIRDVVLRTPAVPAAELLGIEQSPNISPAGGSFATIGGFV